MFKRSSNNKDIAKAARYTLNGRLWALRAILAILFLVAYKMSMAQTKGNAKLYGYKQNVSGGVAPDRSQEPGSANAASGGTNYYIYLVSSNGSRIYPSELWIDGTLYGVQIKSIAKTPVRLESPDPALNSQELVPKTAQRVTQLIPTSANGVKKSAKSSSLANGAAVVAVYKQNGKFYYTTLNELSSLESAAMQ